jgi:DNA (cytosine-5)-methyltransferase 1
VASLFAGGGGSSLGYSMAGYREVFASDFDPTRARRCGRTSRTWRCTRATSRSSRRETILRAGGLEVGELDVLDGSPPCQGFSTAGLREMGDQRNRLFEQYARLLGSLRPRAFVMENVSGMVKGKMRFTFREILLALRGRGYRVRAAVLNAQDYGVPQHRERIIFIGAREDLAVEPSHPQPTVRRPITTREAVDWRTDPPDAAGMPQLCDSWLGARAYAHVRQGGCAADVPRNNGMWFTNVMKISPGKPSHAILKSSSGHGWGRWCTRRAAARSRLGGMDARQLPGRVPARRQVRGADRADRQLRAAAPHARVAQHVRGMLEQARQAGRGVSRSQMTWSCEACGYTGGSIRLAAGGQATCPNCGSPLVPETETADDVGELARADAPAARMPGEDAILALLRAGSVPEEEILAVDTGAVVANLLETTRGYERDPLAELAEADADAERRGDGPTPGVTLELEAPARPACARCLLPMPGRVSLRWREGASRLSPDAVGRALDAVASRLHTEGTLAEQAAALLAAVGAQEVEAEVSVRRQCAGCGAGSVVTTARARRVSPGAGDPPQHRDGG